MLLVSQRPKSVIEQCAFGLARKLDCMQNRFGSTSAALLAFVVFQAETRSNLRIHVRLSIPGLRQAALERGHELLEHESGNTGPFRGALNLVTL